MKIHLRSFFPLILTSVSLLSAQTVDDTVLKQMIIFGRHAVRTPVLPNQALDHFSALPFPDFSASGISVITPNGAKNETNLGAYFRLWLTQEKLLTGNDTADSNFIYFRANNPPLITDTAKAFWAGMLPTAGAPKIDVISPGNDPLFSPVAAGVALLDSQMAVAAVNGRIGGNPGALASAYAPELALTRSILFHYSANSTPVPPTPAGKFDVTDFSTMPIVVAPGNSSGPINLGGLNNVIFAIDPFVMEYADGLPDAEVGWGQLSADGISQTFRLYNLALDLEYRTPYLARVQSSNLASHIARSLVQGATGNPTPGAIASPATKVIALIAANTNIAGLAGLFHLDWLLPGYQPDVSAPSGALVFELRQSMSSGEYIVRTSYVAQTMDQLRHQTALTLAAPPAIAPVFVPGCSMNNATFDCLLADFVQVTGQTIDPDSVDFVN